MPTVYPIVPCVPTSHHLKESECRALSIIGWGKDATHMALTIILSCPLYTNPLQRIISYMARISVTVLVYKEQTS